MYALLDAIAARVGDGRAAAPGKASAARLAAPVARRRSATAWRGRVLAGAFPLAIAALNRLGLGPLKADLSGVELRRASLRAMGEVVARLGIDARHVIFGHTHRSGPLPDDDANEWRLAGGAQLINTGCWVYESMYLDRHWGNPYWPGARGRARERRRAALRAAARGRRRRRAQAAGSTTPGVKQVA